MRPALTVKYSQDLDTVTVYQNQDLYQLLFMYTSWIFPCQMVSIHMKAWHAIDLDGWICCCLARFPKVKVQHSSSTSWKPQTLSTLLSSEWTRKRDRISLLAFGMAIKPTSWSLHCISFLLPPGCCTRVCSRDFMVKLSYLSEVNLSVHHTFEN